MAGPLIVNRFLDAQGKPGTLTAETYRRLPEKLRRDGRIPGKPTPLFSPASVPAAFHVALDGSVRVGEFRRA